MQRDWARLRREDIVGVQGAILNSETTAVVNVMQHKLLDTEFLNRCLLSVQITGDKYTVNRRYVRNLHLLNADVEHNTDFQSINY